MSHQIKSLRFFLEQIKDLDDKSKRIINDKIELIKQNPYRYKRVHSRQYSKVFRIRFSIQSKETRLIYVIIEPNIILICLLDRKKDYQKIDAPPRLKSHGLKRCSIFGCQENLCFLDDRHAMHDRHKKFLLKEKFLHRSL